MNQPLPTAYRGPLLVHASMRVDLASCESPLIQKAGWNPRDPLATLGAIIAVGRLADACSAAVGGTGCECGDWADDGAHHWRLDEVQALPRPIVALGRLDLWEPAPTLVTEVRTMLAAAELKQIII